MRRITVMAVFLVTLAVATSGCYRTTVETGASPSHVITTRVHGFLWGLVGGDVRAPCDVAQVTTKRGFVDLIAQWFTLGIYTPTSVEITCAGAASEY